MPVTINRPVRRESSSLVFSRGSRPVIVSLEPPGRTIGLRAKGTRKTFYLAIDFCYREAIRQDLLAKKAAREQARKAKKL